MGFDSKGRNWKRCVASMNPPMGARCSSVNEVGSQVVGDHDSDTPMDNQNRCVAATVPPTGGRCSSVRVLESRGTDDPADAQAQAEKLKHFSHDVRRMLQRILFDAGTLRFRDPDSEEAARIEQTVLELRDILAQFEGNGPVAEGVLNVAEEVRRLLRGWRAEYSERDFVVQMRLDERARVQMARVDLSRALMNLLNNAAEAMGHRGLLRVSCRREGRWVVICVKDNGPGLAPGVRGRLGADGVSSKGTHRGQGLGSVRECVARAGGTFTLTSGRRGMRAEIWLPAAEEEEK